MCFLGDELLIAHPVYFMLEARVLLESASCSTASAQRQAHNNDSITAPRRAQPRAEGGAPADRAAHGGGDAGRRLQGRRERAHDDPGHAPRDAADEAREATLVDAPA